MRTRINTILAVTALVVAVFGGTPVGHAAASMVIPKGSVGTDELKAGAVTGAKIRNGTLTAAKFKAGTLLAGPQGAQGAAGPAGPQGPSGPAGLSGFQVVAATPVAIGAGQQLSSIASCPAGKKAIGGTASTSNQPLAFRWLGPAAGSDFLATAKNIGTAPDTLYVQAICVTVAG